MNDHLFQLQRRLTLGADGYLFTRDFCPQKQVENLVMSLVVPQKRYMWFLLASHREVAEYPATPGAGLMAENHPAPSAETTQAAESA